MNLHLASPGVAFLASHSATAPDAVTMLDALTRGIQETLKANLVGVYLRGSLALGDFNPVTSDLDFLAVTSIPISDAEFTALAALHGELARLPNKYADQLEGSYIYRDALKHFLPGERRHPTIGPDWDFCWGEHRDNWLLERWIVREHGIVLVGPDPRSLIDPISQDELRDAVRGELAARVRDWANLPDAPDWLLPRYYQAFEVETMCRALYTLVNGALPTKPHAVAWALQTLPAPWNDLVKQSQLWRADKFPDPHTVPDVQRFALWSASEGETFLPAMNGRT